MQKPKRSIEVWDPLLRSFHWLLVAAFATAWWSEGRDIRVHLLAGSLIPGLLLFRLIWGLGGERHARFSSFRPSFAAMRHHLRELLRFKGGDYAGHTPLGSLMIYLLLAGLMTLSVSGMMLMGLQTGRGPFAGWAESISFATEWQLQHLHQWSFQALQCLVVIHLAGVAVESILQKSNLTLAMLTGKKNRKEVVQ